MGHEIKEAEFFRRSTGFEWDERKRLSNLAKHGIDFADATEPFSDPRQFTCRSPHSSELRYVTIGRSKGRLIAVISTPREGRLRIISARAARKRERDEYG